MKIDLFEMERYQSRYWHEVDYDLSESGVLPMTIRELLGPAADGEAFVAGTYLGYPLSEGSFETRTNIASWYPAADAEHVTVVNGGSEANFLALWTLLKPEDRLAFMVPNYLQGRGLGRHFGRGTDTFRLRLGGHGWALDLDELNDAVGKRTKVVMVCNPNNPTGSRPDIRRDGRGRGGRRSRGRLDRRRRDLPRRRVGLRRHLPHLLRPLRQGRGDQRPVQGVRDARPARWDGSRHPSPS